MVQITDLNIDRYWHAQDDPYSSYVSSCGFRGQQVDFSLLLIHFHLGLKRNRRVSHGIKHSCLSAEPHMKMILHEKTLILLALSDLPIFNASFKM